MQKGRPKGTTKEVTRDKALNIRLSRDEFNKLERLATESGKTKTEIVVRGIDLVARKNKKAE